MLSIFTLFCRRYLELFHLAVLPLNTHSSSSSPQPLATTFPLSVSVILTALRASREWSRAVSALPGPAALGFFQFLETTLFISRLSYLLCPLPRAPPPPSPSSGSLFPCRSQPDRAASWPCPRPRWFGVPAPSASRGFLITALSPTCCRCSVHIC